MTTTLFIVLCAVASLGAGNAALAGDSPLTAQQRADLAATGRNIIVPSHLPAGFRVEKVAVDRSHPQTPSSAILFAGPENTCFVIEMGTEVGDMIVENEKGDAVKPTSEIKNPLLGVALFWDTPEYLGTDWFPQHKDAAYCIRGNIDRSVFSDDRTAIALCKKRMDSAEFIKVTRSLRTTTYGSDCSEEICRDHLRRRITRAAEAISAAELKGQVVACAMQRYIQAKLNTRCGLYSKAGHQLDLLERELPDQKIQRRALVQDEEGSFGACSDDWTLKLDASMEGIWQATRLGTPLPVLPSFLDAINSPERLERMFSLSLDPKGGLPTRCREAALNNLTGVVALLFRGMPKEYRFHPGLKAALTKILDERWQDPATGFWGVPVWHDGDIEMLPNISITFHIIGYRGGKVKRWPQLVETILSMKDGEWPRGWTEDGRFSHHHLYDVIRFFRLGWTHMSSSQRERAGRELEAMLAESVKRLLTPGYDFDDPNADEAMEAIDYHVFFHDEIGSLRPGPAFWRDGPALDPETRSGVVASLQARLSQFNVEANAEAQRAQRILSESAERSSTPSP